MQINKKQKIENDIIRYITGNCTESEHLRVSVLVNEDADYKSQYENLKKIWSLSKTPTQVDFNPQKAWDNVSAKIFNNQQESQIETTPIYKISENSLSRRRFLRYASSIAAVLMLGIGLFFMLQNKDSKLISYAQADEKLQPYTFSDGSVATLNTNSKIKFPKTFSKNSRVVYLWGEAFFEIASEPERPFIVSVDDLNIKVLGTSFNVFATENQIDVSVKTGKVLCFRVDKNNNILGDVFEISKGQKAVYKIDSKEIYIDNTNCDNATSWLTGNLVFEAQNLNDVLNTISKHYNTSFNIDNPEISNLKLTANFKNESLETVLQTISLIHNINFIQNDKGYSVK